MAPWDPETMARTVKGLNKRLDLVGFWGAEGRPRLPRSGAYTRFVNALDARRRVLSRRNTRLRKRSRDALEVIRQLLKNPATRALVSSIVRQRTRKQRGAT